MENDGSLHATIIWEVVDRVFQPGVMKLLVLIKNN